MAYSHYDRLSALDAMFLSIEAPNVHMHVGAAAIFDAGPVTNAEGLLDIDRIRALLESGLSRSPRFRQRLDRIALFDHPVWIDDARFNLSYHLRHTSLPRPGALRTLKRLVGRIMSQKLDRGKPLWEMWIVEGIEEGRFAVIVKAHHCMVDGISGLDLLASILRLDRNPNVEPAGTWIPRPHPSAARLLADELWHRASLPLALADASRRAITQPRRLLGDVKEAALGFGEMLSAGLKPTSQTAFNPEIGPYRRFDWTRMELDAVKEAKTRHGGTLNDVVLACTAGAIGHFLERRGERSADVVFRAQIPMSIRTPAERGSVGNRVVMLMADLPVGEPDPVRRLHAVSETTRQLKGSRQSAGVEFLEELSNQAVTSLFFRFAQLATAQRSYNMVVTNIPGPQVPIYLLGARMLEIYPLVPLAGNQALGIALFSYAGGLYWGFNADWDGLPDLHDFVETVDHELEHLRKAEPLAHHP